MMDPPTATATPISVSSFAPNHELFFIPSKSEPNEMEVNVCLSNISGRALFYRIKKQKEASIRILPLKHSGGRIDPHSNKMITIVWTNATPSNPSVKLLMETSLNSNDFGGPRSAQTRLVGRIAEQPRGIYNPNEPPFVLLMDAPRAGLMSPIISPVQSSTGNAIPIRTNEADVSIFLCYLYFILVIALGWYYHSYYQCKQQSTALTQQQICNGYAGGH